MTSHFYRVFEDQHRGPRDLIKERLRVYLGFVEPLTVIDCDVKAIDLGCGRGEWLEILQEAGINATGIDLDEGMLDACRDIGLKVNTGDAVSYLKTLADDSQLIVSAFHLVEHLVFEQLQELVFQAHRVLKPGGILIMETPNPENIVVATCNFYLDPTHQRPIPPELLKFVAKFYGFARAKVIRLQEPADLAEQQTLTLQDVLGGASPDYSVVAQKSASGDVMALLDSPFLTEYGVNLENLSARYQKQISGRIGQANRVAEQAETTSQQAHGFGFQARHVAQQAETLARQAQAGALQAENNSAQALAAVQEALIHSQQVENAARTARLDAQAAELKAAQAEQLLKDVFNSRSWRITAPLRWCKYQWQQLRRKGFRSRGKAAVKKAALPFVRHGFGFVSKRPAFKTSLVRLAHHMGVYKSLQQIYWRVSQHPDYTRPNVGNSQVFTQSADSGKSINNTNDYLRLTPVQRKIYGDVAAAIKKNKEFVHAHRS